MTYDVHDCTPPPLCDQVNCLGQEARRARELRLHNTRVQIPVPVVLVMQERDNGFQSIHPTVKTRQKGYE